MTWRAEASWRPSSPADRPPPQPPAFAVALALAAAFVFVYGVVGYLRRCSAPSRPVGGPGVERGLA